MHLLLYLALFFLESEMFQTKVVEKIKAPEVPVEMNLLNLCPQWSV
jgi:hypothetical protein